MTVQAKEYAGAAAATTLSGSISNVSATIACVDASTFPTGSTAPFVVAIDRGTASEEKVLITSRTGNSLTVTTRGYDGTTAASHASGATIEHVLDAVSFTDANKTAVQTIAKVTTAGDILVGTGAEAMKRLGIGAAYKAIGANAAANDLTYLDTMASLLTTKGDIPTASAANTPARVAVGSAGQHLGVASGLPAWTNIGVPTVVRKTADESVTSSTTLQDDDHIFQAIAASEIWAFQIWLSYLGATAGDIQVGLTVPSGAALRAGALGLDQLATSGAGNIYTPSGTSFSGAAYGAISGNEQILVIAGLVVNSTNPGNITLQWAQNTSSGTATTVRTSSYGMFTRGA